ncbi:hypothetical protein [Mucilaginibacter agri]|uniref:NHL repeat-containing protein n=1 Tax=Mucilaginibacter agri TaxID=2695265 RepID=A0A966DV04_9SPHI|nr:hypothetical protein [Mucilaginibacter agri]NCD72340.1 hypothetical protein [Mucilaginibacter agri]
MKSKILLVALLGLSIAGCKKTEELSGKPNNVEAASPEAQAAIAAGTTLPLTIQTIAGKTGEHFQFANGLDLADDGNLYVADQNASLIRKVTPAGVVTTVPIPNSPDNGFALHSPMRVRVQKDGTINILTINTVGVVAFNNMWIVKPNGQALTPPFAPASSNNTNATRRSYDYDDLQTDKITGDVWVSGVNLNTGNSMIQKFKISPQGYLGTDEINWPRDSVYRDPTVGNGPDVRTFYIGYNGVRYIVMNYKSIYKLTPSGVFTRIFRDLTFSNINCIVGTKDGRTLYIVDDAALKRIVDGKLQYISGPSKPFDAHDGVGVYADIRPIQLALSKDESTLYFTDTRQLIRKVLLK